MPKTSTYVFAWTPNTPGMITLTAVVTDQAGFTQTSQPVYAYVQNAGYLSIQEPNSGYFTVGQTYTVNTLPSGAAGAGARS